MTMIDRLEFPEWKFTLAFMATIPEDQKAALPTPGTEEAHTFLWGFTGTSSFNFFFILATLSWMCVGYTQAQGAALSCLRLRLADMVLI